MPELLSEYLPIAVFFAIALGLAIALVTGSLLLGNQRPDDEKMAAYECGFDAFDDSRRQFDVRFYLVAILFIISIWKSRSCSRGRYRLVGSACSGSGR